MPTLVDQHTTHHNDAQTARAQAQSTLAAGNALSAARAEMVQTREQLAAVETPADAAPLLANLEQQTIAVRALQAEVLEARVAVELAESDLERAAAQMEWASRRVGATQDDLEAAQQDHEDREKLKSSLDDPPLDTLPAEAGDALTTAPENQTFVDAKARIEADIPAELIGRARERRTHRAALRAAREDGLANVRALVADELDKKRGVLGKLRKRRIEFEFSETALRDYVSRAADRSNHARSLLERVADPEVDPLSAEQTARITEQAVVDARILALPKEQAVEVTELALVLAELDLEDETLKKGPDIAAKQTVRDNARTAWEQAGIDYSPALRNDLNTWEAAVPDATWRLLSDFEEAHATLLSLAADPGTLRSALTQAETNLAAALDNVDNSEVDLRARETAAARRATTVRLEIDLARPALFGALRGDG